MPSIYNNCLNPINWDKIAKIPIFGNVTSLIRIPINVLKGLFAVINYVGSAITNRETIKAEAQFKASVTGFSKGIIGVIPIIGTIAAIYLFKKQTFDSTKNDENPKHTSNEKLIKKNLTNPKFFKWDTESIRKSMETEQSRPIGRDTEQSNFIETKTEQSKLIESDTDPKNSIAKKESSLAKKAHRWFNSKFESQINESKPQEIIVDFFNGVPNIEVINIDETAERARGVSKELKSLNLSKYNDEISSYSEYIERIILALEGFSTNRDLSTEITFITYSGYVRTHTAEQIFQKALFMSEEQRNLYHLEKLANLNKATELQKIIEDTIKFLKTFIEPDSD